MHSLPGERALMRIHLGERDGYHGKPLYQAIVGLLRQRHYAGATVYRAIMGFGASAQARGFGATGSRRGAEARRPGALPSGPPAPSVAGSPGKVIGRLEIALERSRGPSKVNQSDFRCAPGSRGAWRRR